MRETPKTRPLDEVIIISIAVIMGIAVTPFAIYRFVTEQYFAFAAEAISLTVMALIAIHIWKKGSTRRINLITSIFMLTGLVSFSYIMGISILYWSYPIIMTVHFLNTPLRSTLLVSGAMVALIPLLTMELSLFEVITIMVTLTICQLFSYFVARTIRRQYAQLGILINQDGLTGALNRRAFGERLEYLYQTATEHNIDIATSLIMFDIDHFKAINDEFGHQEGDEILINLTDVVKQAIRSEDRLYRYGGEEFVIIAKNAKAKKSADIAEKIRQAIEHSDISTNTIVTASFGVAEFHKYESSSEWVKRADEALYKAKNLGRNQVSIDSTPENPKRRFKVIG